MTEEPDNRIEQNRRMRALSDTARAEAIAASPNVIGFERFTEKAQQVALSQGYRRPRGGGVA